MKLSSTLFAGAALAAFSGIAWAQTPTAPNAATMPSPATSPSSTAAPAAKPAANLTRMDAYFVQQAASGGAAEAKAAQLARQQSSNEQVKQFAQTVIDDHAKANERLSSLATEKGLALPPDAAESNDDSLQNLKGAAFDRRYAENEVKDHEDTVKLFQQEQQQGSDGDLKAFASDTLPTVEQHLDKAKQLSANVSGTASRHHPKNAAPENDDH